jgi:hypothetical protein
MFPYKMSPPTESAFTSGTLSKDDVTRVDDSDPFCEINLIRNSKTNTEMRIEMKEETTVHPDSS